MILNTIKIQSKEQFRIFVRSVSNKNENVLLADALNLLSPKKQVKNETGYQPSLLTSLTRGSVQEQYANSDIIGLKIAKDDKKVDYLNNLLAGIKSSSMASTSIYDLLNMGPREVLSYVKKLESEKELCQVADVLYFQNRLTLKLLINIVLNKNLKSLKKLPLDVYNIEQNVNLKWEPIHYINFKIILLKKWYDMKEPLMIVKDLKKHFERSYLPTIESGALSPFYERIVWKFYFEFVKQYDEIDYINSLADVKSSFLIWESSSRNEMISEHLVKSSLLNAPQKLFFKLCSAQTVLKRIATQLEQSGHSRLLSKLKKISIRYKLYGFDGLGERRAEHYSYMNTLEKFIEEEKLIKQIQNPDQDTLQMMSILRDINFHRGISLTLPPSKRTWNEGDLVPYLSNS